MKKLIISLGYHNAEELEGKLGALAPDLINGWLTDRAEQLSTGLLWNGEDFQIVTVDEVETQLNQPTHPAKVQLMWAFHNLIAHPISEFCYWLGFVYKPIQGCGEWLHDATIPPHEPGQGRG